MGTWSLPQLHQATLLRRGSCTLASCRLRCQSSSRGTRTLLGEDSWRWTTASLTGCHQPQGWMQSRRAGSTSSRRPSTFRTAQTSWQGSARRTRSPRRGLLTRGRSGTGSRLSWSRSPSRARPCSRQRARRRAWPTACRSGRTPISRRSHSLHRCQSLLLCTALSLSENLQSSCLPSKQLRLLLF